ncbi:hypothetical protein ACS0TY_006410 [Phlomoides rotata]
MVFHHEMARKYYNLLLQCQESDEAREIIENSYSRDFVTINTRISSTTSAKQVEHSDANVNVLDPDHSVTKGRSKRIKGYFRRRVVTHQVNSPPPKEFGFNTPAEFDFSIANLYYYSKTVAKDKAREYAKESGLDIVTVCPGLVVGPMLQHSTNARSLALIKLLRGIYYQIRVFL